MQYFGVKAPAFRDTMQAQLSEIEIDTSYGISPMTTLARATQIIQENHQNSLSIVDDDQKLMGVISLSNITNSYATIWNDNILGRSDTPLENIVEVLSGQVVYLPEHPRERTG